MKVEFLKYEGGHVCMKASGRLDTNNANHLMNRMPCEASIKTEYLILILRI